MWPKNKCFASCWPIHTPFFVHQGNVQPVICRVDIDLVTWNVGIKNVFFLHLYILILSITNNNSSWYHMNIFFSLKLHLFSNVLNIPVGHKYKNLAWQNGFITNMSTTFYAFVTLSSNWFSIKMQKKYCFISNLPTVANLPGGHLILTKHKI